MKLETDSVIITITEKKQEQQIVHHDILSAQVQIRMKSGTVSKIISKLPGDKLLKMDIEKLKHELELLLVECVDRVSVNAIIISNYRTSVDEPI